ncbi:MAG: NADAR domain-containing protein [Chlamydiales bacterium]
MLQIIYLKFSQNPTLKDKLVATAPATLIEQTDNMFWGEGPSHTVEKGENKLGKILMDERAFIIEESRRTNSLPAEKI